jgi:hypothetical protein
VHDLGATQDLRSPVVKVNECGQVRGAMTSNVASSRSGSVDIPITAS